MKKTIIAFGTLAGLFLLLCVPSGCFYDNEEDLYGTGTTPCDTVNMRYSVEIKQILQDNCYDCHLPSLPATYSGIPFETYDQLKVVALNGQLVERINSAAAPMPQTGLMLPCNREKMEAWVNAGAP
ncbi:MAG: hypothetical protein KDC65_01760, partial [Saprospiraceae bacterium]|nr:hypothetical protein [Saprospiraceae bacterium]